MHSKATATTAAAAAAAKIHAMPSRFMSESVHIQQNARVQARRAFERDVSERSGCMRQSSERMQDAMQTRRSHASLVALSGQCCTMLVV